MATRAIIVFRADSTVYYCCGVGKLVVPAIAWLRFSRAGFFSGVSLALANKLPSYFSRPI